MSDQTVIARLSLLDRFLKTFGLFLVCVMGLSGCPKLLCDIGIADQCATYTVTYAPNGADSGNVPVDGAEYQQGDTVTVQGNTGGLSRSGYSFAGWNTAANGGGTSYSEGSIITMGAVNVVLYAEWSADEDDEVWYDEYEPDNSMDEATDLSNGETQYHGFHEEDEDWYKIWVEVLSLIHI